MSWRLLLADDHEVVRRNLREIIEFKTDCVIVGEAVDGHQAVVLASRGLQKEKMMRGSFRRPSVSGRALLIFA